MPFFSIKSVFSYVVLGLIAFLLPWAFSQEGVSENNDSEFFSITGLDGLPQQDDRFLRISSWGIQLELANEDSREAGTPPSFRYAGRLSSGENDYRILLSEQDNEVINIGPGQSEYEGFQLELNENEIILSDEENTQTVLRLFPILDSQELKPN